MAEAGRNVYRLAVLTAALTFPLLAVGGVVTSRDAGMIFADWPLSDGSVNPQGWIRNPDKRSEHGHRILGALVGLSATALVIAVWRTRQARGIRFLSVAAWIGVAAQGVLGGLRVREVSTGLAMLHGCTGQAVFGLLVALAYFLSRDGLEAHPVPAQPVGLRLASVGATALIYLQVILGAKVRHIQGPLFQHLLGAVIVAAAVLWVLAAALWDPSGDRRLRRPALLLGGLGLLQVSLGFWAASVLLDSRRGDPTLAQVFAPTAHQATGALMFVTALVLALRTFRRTIAVSMRTGEALA